MYHLNNAKGHLSHGLAFKEPTDVMDLSTSTISWNIGAGPGLSRSRRMAHRTEIIYTYFHVFQTYMYYFSLSLIFIYSWGFTKQKKTLWLRVVGILPMRVHKLRCKGSFGDTPLLPPYSLSDSIYSLSDSATWWDWATWIIFSATLYIVSATKRLDETQWLYIYSQRLYI